MCAAPSILLGLVLLYRGGAFAGLLSVAQPLGSAAEPVIYEVWETARDGNRLEQLHPRSVGTSSPADVTLTVFPDLEGQTIVGFGAAMTQASGVVWRNLSAVQQRRVIDLFFGKDGLRASLARIPINSCDFAEASYSLDDVADDFELRHFNEALPDDEAHLIPLVRAALAANPHLSLLASPWSYSLSGDRTRSVPLRHAPLRPTP